MSNRYSALSHAAGGALLEIDRIASEKGHSDFLRRLIFYSRALARKEKRQIVAKDWLSFAEQIWPNEGPELINRYHVLFVK